MNDQRKTNGARGHALRQSGLPVTCTRGHSLFEQKTVVYRIQNTVEKMRTDDTGNQTYKMTFGGKQTLDVSRVNVIHHTPRSNIVSGTELLIRKEGSV